MELNPEISFLWYVRHHNKNKTLSNVMKELFSLEQEHSYVYHRWKSENPDIMFCEIFRLDVGEFSYFNTIIAHFGKFSYFNTIIADFGGISHLSNFGEFSFDIFPLRYNLVAPVTWHFPKTLQITRLLNFITDATPENKFLVCRNWT